MKTLSKLILGAAAAGMVIAITRKGEKKAAGPKGSPEGIGSGSRFLFVGDSLTVGFGTDNKSYVDQLKDRYPKMDAKKIAITGKQTGWMLEQLQKELSTGTRYDVITIWGGVNDIYAKKSIDDAKKNLQKMYDLAKSKGAKVVALSVIPTNTYKISSSVTSGLTKMLNAWIGSNSSIDKLIDANEIVNDGQGGTREEYLQKDKLHLTAAAQSELMRSFAKKLSLDGSLSGPFNMQYAKGKIALEIDDAQRPVLQLKISQPVKEKMSIDFTDPIAKRQFFSLFSRLYDSAEGLDPNNIHFMNDTVAKLFKYYEEEFRSLGVKIPKYESTANGPKKVKAAAKNKNKRFFIFYIDQFVEKLKATQIIIPGFEEYEFFIHRSYDPDPEKSPVHDGNSWCVTEGRTGAIVASADAKQETIDKAIETLNKVGKEEAAKVFARTIEKNGISPRYSKSGSADPIKLKALALELELELIAA